MNRRPIVSAAALVLGMGLPGAATAQMLNYYVATPMATPGKGKLVTSGTPWFVRGASVMAPRAPERPERVCAMVAAKIGTLTAFSAAGRSFGTDELATCNAAAKPVA